MAGQKDKVKALYDAVRDCMDEGENPENVSVSELSRRAGIGKGTVYEYFENKEELLSAALTAILQTERDRLMENVERSPSFETAFYSCLQWIYENRSKYVLMTQFLREQAQREGKCEEGQAVVQDLLQLLTERAGKDGLPKETNTGFFQMEVFGKLMEYFLWLTFVPEISQEENRGTKDALYGTIRKSFF